MRLPKTVKVCGHILKVEEVASEVIADFYGQYQRSKGLIQINEEQAPSQKAATLLHEVFHALFAESPLKELGVDKEIEEAIVVILETGLYQIMRDNPKMVKYIMDAGQ